MRDKEVLSYHVTVPPGKFWEGLYIDDHACLSICNVKSVHKFRAGCPVADCGDPALTRHVQVLHASHAAYAEHHLERAVEKGTHLAEDFVCWGTAVANKSGRVGTPLPKLSLLAWFMALFLSLPFCN